MIAGGAGHGREGSCWPRERVRCNTEASGVNEDLYKVGQHCQVSSFER